MVSTMAMAGKMMKNLKGTFLLWVDIRSKYDEDMQF